MVKQNDAYKCLPLEDVRDYFDEKLFAKTHTTHFIPEKTAKNGYYYSPQELDDVIRHFEAVHELHCIHKREGCPSPKF